MVGAYGGIKSNDDNDGWNDDGDDDKNYPKNTNIMIFSNIY